MKARCLLVFICLSVTARLSHAGPPFAEFVDPNPNPGNQFGGRIVPLSTGNVVITSTRDDAGGTDAGAVYLFNGATGALISTIRGSKANDQVGSEGVTDLGNGNFVILSPGWDNGSVVDVGAVTWGSGTTGLSGVVSSSNSLVGSTASDRVGSTSAVVKLNNGNYVVRSLAWDNGSAVDAGAVTWGSGISGVSGVISSGNSLVGTTTNDGLFSQVLVLTSSNYVVFSQNWNNGAIVDAGAWTWGSGTVGIKGVVSSANSMVGTATNDKVGQLGLALSNGNYIMASPVWDNGAAVNAGAVTWCDGTLATVGTLSSTNSLVGSKSNDSVGLDDADRLALLLLSNGNYVVRSAKCDDGSILDAGAVTWGSGSSGVKGVVSSTNSLMGSKAGEKLGADEVTGLTNGNYVVWSSRWQNISSIAVGAYTWCNGTTGRTGQMTAGNSLIGSTVADFQSGSGTTVVPLSDGDYVVRSSRWDNGSVADVGAATWGNGTSGVVGTLSIANSLIGSTTGDGLGLGIVALTNGNYVVYNYSWSNGSTNQVGAVTWGSGTSGIAGVVSSSNSLVGTTALDRVGQGAVIALPNGNYVVKSTGWNNGAAAGAGAVTWGSGTSGVSGPVTASNSLVGTQASDQVGADVTVLSNGNYLVNNFGWANGANTRAGAITWSNGTTSSPVGPVNSSNSLVGSKLNEGNFVQVTPLNNGNYVVSNRSADSGAATNAGAVTWGSGISGVSGTYISSNSLLGSTTEDIVGHVGVKVLSNGNYVVPSGFYNGVTTRSGAFTFALGATGLTGTISSSNSLLGLATGGASGVVVEDTVNGTFYCSFASEDGGRVRVGSIVDGVPSPRIEIRGNGVVIASGDTTPSPVDDTDFSGVPLLNTQSTRSFAISNIGPVALNLTGAPRVEISGPAAGDFLVTSPPNSPLAANAGTSFEITFDPSLPGARTATVTVRSTDNSTPIHTFAITGYGSLAKLETQTITFAPPATLYSSQRPFALTATASSGLLVTLTVVSGPGSLSDLNLSYNGFGTVKITATQTGNGEYAAAKAVTKSIVIKDDPTTMTLLNLTQTYNGSPKPISTLGASSPTITYKIGTVEGATAPTNAGKYAVKAVAGSVIKTGTLTIAKAVITITPDDKRKLLGLVNPPLTFRVTGLRGTDLPTVITKLPLLTTTAKTTSPLGIYPIKASGATALNYTFNYQLGSLVVDSFAGNYEALLTDVGTGLPVGKLNVSVPTAGKTFTGKLATATETAALSIKGPLVTDAMTGRATGTITVTKNTIPYVVTFTLPPYGDVTSTVTRSGNPLGSASSGRKLLALPKGRLANYAGAHTVVLQPPTPAGSGIPLGAGWATATVATTGTMTMVGKLPDGTAFTASLPADVSTDPGYRLWVQPYKAARSESYLGGSFALTVHPNLNNNPSLVTRRFVEQAGMTWKKTGLPADTTFRAGFGPVSTIMLLDPWLKPQLATKTLPAITLATRLGLTGNAITVSHSPTGSLANGNLPTALALTATNTPTVTIPLANTTKWKTTKLDAATGKIEGTFELLDGAVKRLATFSGILRQTWWSGDTEIGDGHYIVAPPSGTEKLTGEILFQR